jgi:hypothetical protein
MNINKIQQALLIQGPYECLSVYICWCGLKKIFNIALKLQIFKFF